MATTSTLLPRAFVRLSVPRTGIVSRQFGDFFSQRKTVNFSQQKVLGYTPKQVYDVVSQVQHYARFVPWCRSSAILHRNSSGCTAELVVGFPPVTERYISNVTLKPNSFVKAVSADTTLFKSLESTWKLSAPPTIGKNSCLIDFEVSYEFRSSLHNTMANLFFEEVTKQMVSAFEKRCSFIYGPSLVLKNRQVQVPLPSS